MSEFKSLPDAEFDVMQMIWGQPSPISSVQIFALLTPEKNWKPQTLLTLLTRLEKRGFLSSEKRGRERFYTPFIARKDYLKKETNLFIKRYHMDSLTGLFSAFFDGKKPKEEELNEIEAWLEEQK